MEGSSGQALLAVSIVTVMADMGKQLILKKENNEKEVFYLLFFSPSCHDVSSLL